MTLHSPTKQIRIVIVDDHPAMRSGLRALIEDDHELTVVGEAVDGATGLEAFSNLKPDVTIMDLQLPDMDGETVISEILVLNPKAVIIALTTFGGSDTIKRTLAAGARGFLLKDSARREIVDAVKRAFAGHRIVRGVVAERLADSMMFDDLTPRELDVLKSLSTGNSNKAIAFDLGISESTVKIHLGNILEKLGATDRTDAVLKSLERGVIRVR